MTAIVPAGPEEITADWLTRVLRESGAIDAATVTSVAIASIGVGRGFAGRTLRIAIGYDRDEDGAPASLVAKLPSNLGGPRRDAAVDRLTSALYGNEIQWYRHLAARCPVRVPRCYWSGAEPEARRFCILLEDLGTLAIRGQAASCADQTARGIVRGLADLHARWWNAPELFAYPWLWPPAVQAQFVSLRFAEAWEPFWAELGPRLDPRFRAIGEQLCTALPGLVVDGAAAASTLIHGDYRLENFLFDDRGAGEELVVLDWQTIGRGSGPRDLAYFISQSLTIEARRRIEPELLDLYYARLTEQEVTGYSFEQYQADYRRGLLVSLHVPVAGVLAILRAVPPADTGVRATFDAAVQAGRALVDVIAERAVSAVMDNDAASVLAG